MQFTMMFAQMAHVTKNKQCKYDFKSTQSTNACEYKLFFTPDIFFLNYDDFKFKYYTRDTNNERFLCFNENIHSTVYINLNYFYVKKNKVL